MKASTALLLVTLVLAALSGAEADVFGNCRITCTGNLTSSGSLCNSGAVLTTGHCDPVTQPTVNIMLATLFMRIVYGALCAMNVLGFD